jgi:hypothetical protein
MIFKNLLIKMLAILFLLISIVEIKLPYNYILLIIGILLITYNIKEIAINKTNFLNINIILFGPLLVILGITKNNENLKNLSFIVGISIILFHMKGTFLTW